MPGNVRTLPSPTTVGGRSVAVRGAGGGGGGRPDRNQWAGRAVPAAPGRDPPAGGGRAGRAGPLPLRGGPVDPGGGRRSGDPPARRVARAAPGRGGRPAERDRRA